MKIDAFEGRAEAYTIARPGYPKEALEYIRNLAPKNAVFADIGAGTGKFTALLAEFDYKIFAIEPSKDMLKQLKISMEKYKNVEIIKGTAENTTLDDNCVDIITNAQALNRLDLNLFKKECKRIGKTSPIIISLYNHERNGNLSRYNKSTGEFYNNPTIVNFDNPIYFTKDKWLMYYYSMEGVPKESDKEYEEWNNKLIEKFDRESVNGILFHDLITNIFWEKIG